MAELGEIWRLNSYLGVQLKGPKPAIVEQLFNWVMYIKNSHYTQKKVVWS